MKPLNIRGATELDDFLSTLAPKLGRSVVRGGMRVLAKTVADEAVVRCTSEEVKPTIGVSGGVRQDGTIYSKVRTKGKGAFIAPWLEFGTAAHFISVNLEARPETKTRRGVRKWSIRLINRAAARGSLMIGANFVGQSVYHPGASPHPFFRPAADAKIGDGLVAMGQYISTRLSKEGLNAPLLTIGDDE